MERVIEAKIEELKKKLILMGSHVEQALDEATKGLISKPAARFELVHEIEDKINAEQLAVDSCCMDILAKQAPVARDLRFVVSVLKINTDLERMGDMCANIAHMGKEMTEFQTLEAFSQLPAMVAVVKQMVKNALDAFVRADVNLAKSVLALDDQVDLFKNQAVAKMKEYMQSHPQDITPALNIILIARSLERMGDHATNVAEDVIYAQTGQDVRHGGNAKAQSKENK